MADTQTTSSGSSGYKGSQSFTIYPLPKVVFFYPLMFTALACALLQYFCPKDIVIPKPPVMVPVKQADPNKPDEAVKQFQKIFQNKYVVTIVHEKEVATGKQVIIESDKNVDISDATQKVAGTPKAPIHNVDGVSTIAGSIFILVFLLNILVISFDFPGLKALVLGFCILTVILILWNLGWLGQIGHYLTQLSGTLYASWVFYAMISGTIFIMISCGIIYNKMFNRWVVESNRLLNRHGFFGDFTEYPVVDLQMDKDIDDVLEYALLLSGTLTFRPNPTTPPIRLENVPFINSKERKIRNIIRKIQVKEE